MRAKRLRFMIVAIALLVGTGLVYWQAAHLRFAATSELTDLATQKAELERKLQAAQERLARLKKKAAESPSSVVTSKGASFGTASKPTAGKRTTDLIADDPATEVKMSQWQRAIVGVEYGPFFRRYGISREQIEKFQDDWVKRAEADIDLRAAARQQGPAGADTVAALQAQSKAANEQATRALFGSEAYEQLKEYERTLPVRNILVFGLAGAAAMDGVPLSAQQGDQLWHAALEASGNNPKADGETMLNNMDWTALDARVQQILSPAQFELFKHSAPPAGFRSRQEYEFDQIVRRAREADAGASASLQ